MASCRRCDKYKKLIYELRNKNVGYGIIARLTGTNVNTIIYHCKKQGIAGFRGPVTQKKAAKPKVVYLNVCWHCGEQFITKRKKVKFCGTSCNEKHNRLKLKGTKHCAVCGKQIDVRSKGNTKYCSKECMAVWYKEHPRYSNTCDHCGKEFKTNMKAQRYCSRGCAGYSISRASGISRSNEKRRTHNEQQFIENFNRKFGKEFEYIDGYVGNNSIITIRCKTHNVIFTRTASFLRKGDEPNCPICQEIAREQKKQLSAEQRRIKQEELYKAREEDRLRIRQDKLMQKEQQRQERIKERTKPCEYCGKVFISNGWSRCCSNECSKKQHNATREIRRRIMIRENGKIDWTLNLSKLIERDKNTCHICKGKCNSNDYVIDGNGYFIAGDTYPSIDHMLPISKGGTHTWGNVRLAHRNCNTVKSNKNCYGIEGEQMRLAL